MLEKQRSLPGGSVVDVFLHIQSDAAHEMEDVLLKFVYADGEGSPSLKVSSKKGDKEFEFRYDLFPSKDTDK
jgi:hypothetical protein